MEKIIIILYLCSIFYGIYILKKFFKLAKIKTKQYNKLLKKIKNQEIKENKLNLFKKDENTAHIFMYTIYILIPLFNLLFIYMIKNYINFLNKEK